VPLWRRLRAGAASLGVIVIVPGAAFLIAFLGVPLLGMLERSFTDPSPHNYAVVWESPLYARVMWTTLRTALIVTAVCLLLAYPYAYLMAMSGPRLRAVLVAIVLVSMWSSLLVRSYAWTVLLQDTGVINDALRSLGIIDEPLALIRTTTGVTIGMTQILLPFMVFPLYAVMRRIDPGLVTAATSLGATPWRAYRRVFLPLSMPGVVAGGLLVFVLSIGFYITPALLGSPSNELFGQLIADQITEQLNFGVASALSAILVLVTIVVLGLGSRVVPLGAALGFGGEDR
jgi:putative spermidine/putrescine transport system permease protein